MSKSYLITDKINLKVLARNFKDGESIIVKLTLLDENKNELASKDDKSIILNYESKYSFVTKELSKSLGIEPEEVYYVRGWMDSDGDGKIDYNEEVEFEIKKTPITIVIDPGHGDIFNKYLDPGAVSSSGHKEKDIALDISKKLLEILNKEKNIKTYLTRTKDLDDKKRVRIIWRTEIVKEKDADIIVSIHLNASSNISVNGFSILTQKDSNNNYSRDLAEHVLKNYSLLKNRGIKSERNLGILRRSEMLGNKKAAILIELGFITNDKDRNIIISQSGNITKNIANGILDYIKENNEIFNK